MKLIGALALVLASAGMGLAEALRLRRRARLTADLAAGLELLRGEIVSRLAPLPDPRLQYAKASLDTPKGLLESGWEYHEDGSVCYRFKVPFDAEAILELPKGTTLNGQDVSYPVVVPTGTYIAVTPSK